MEDKIRELFKTNNLHYYWYIVSSNVVSIYVEWGDWKHDHLRFKNLIDTFSSYCKYIIAVVLATPIEKCLENNSNRDRQVPEQVIRGMANKFVFPSFEEGFDDIIVVGDEANINY